MAAGARQCVVCEQLGIESRTLQRWRRDGIGDDRRAGPNTSPANKLTDAERARAMDIVNSPRFADLSPKQIVPMLADEGIYIASESSIYRLLRAAGQLVHRGRQKPATHHRPAELVATGPNQVWCWDITYLPSSIRGKFFYCYSILDLFSRKLVGSIVHDAESELHAAELIAVTCALNGIRRDQLVLHSDNGGAMKGATMLATLQALGVAASFSRPGVSDDNPFIESHFRTMKFRPEYPSRPFASIEHARSWVVRFTRWYNDQHLHSSIGFVTPEQRHRGADIVVLEARSDVYAQARGRHPSRWSRNCRSWKRVERVVLNPKTRNFLEVAA